ncbi:Aldo/keto reductase [Obba rivulosa]|uniref:Aldo/keto reductase n=1 Tax=Obba rivulosa TaxID=1052685 RepID=A0A8E2AHF8_9APHY|nr:Aldo/keto reductase [Obba rivulosa]
MTLLGRNATFMLASGYNIPALGLNIANRAVTRRQSVGSIVEALRAGYRLFNIENSYRLELEQLGDAIRQSGVRRQDVFIMTTYNTAQRGGKRRHIDLLLGWLGMDYFDLILVHEPESQFERLLAAYQGLTWRQNEGVVKNIGVVNCEVQELQAIQSKFGMPSVNRLELDPCRQQRPLVAYCNRHSVHVQAYCPVNDERWSHVPVIHQIANKYNKDPQQIFLRWCLQHRHSSLISLNLTDTARIHSCAKIFDFSLTNKDAEQIDALERNETDFRKDWMHVSRDVNPPSAHLRRTRLTYEVDKECVTLHSASQHVPEYLAPIDAPLQAPKKLLKKLSRVFLRELKARKRTRESRTGPNTQSPDTPEGQ